jgi:hypothetical protein
MLATRLAKLARIVHRTGGHWSIENPAGSLLWQLPAFRALLTLKGAHMVVGDQCCFGGLYRKPTGWLTNSGFVDVFAARCPGTPRHHREARRTNSLDPNPAPKLPGPKPARPTRSYHRRRATAAVLSPSPVLRIETDPPPFR